MVILGLLYISNLQLLAFQSNGSKLTAEGKKLLYEGKFAAAIEILNEALHSDLTSKKKIETHFLAGVCWIALNSIDNGKRQFWEIIKIDPEYKLDIGKLPPEIKNIFEKAKEQFPVIYNLSVEPLVFHPYKDEKPSLSLMLTAPDCVNLIIKNNDQIIIAHQKCFETPGINTYEWDWNDELLKSDEFNLSLIPEKNQKEYSFERKLKLQIEIPKNLLFRDNLFRIIGRENLPEIWIKKSYPNLLLYSTLGVVMSIGAYSLLTSNPEKIANQQNISKSSSIATGIVGCVIAIASFVKALTPKKKKVPINENIEKNNQLKNEIQLLKEKIEVKQELMK